MKETELKPCEICERWKDIEGFDGKKQREGKWIARKDKGLFGKEYYECSNCHSRNPTIKYNYCKNCGVKMKGGE